MKQVLQSKKSSEIQRLDSKSLSTRLEYSPCSPSSHQSHQITKCIDVSQLKLMKARYSGELDSVPERVAVYLRSRTPGNTSKAAWSLDNFFFDEEGRLEARRIKTTEIVQTDLIVWHPDSIILETGTGKTKTPIPFEVSPFCIKAKIKTRSGEGLVEVFIVLQ